MALMFEDLDKYLNDAEKDPIVENDIIRDLHDALDRILKAAAPIHMSDVAGLIFKDLVEEYGVDAVYDAMSKRMRYMFLHKYSMELTRHIMLMASHQMMIERRKAKRANESTNESSTTDVMMNNVENYKKNKADSKE